MLKAQLANDKKVTLAAGKALKAAASNVKSSGTERLENANIEPASVDIIPSPLLDMDNDIEIVVLQGDMC